MWPVRSSVIHVEAEWDAELALGLPVRVVCDSCGEARALSTITAVLVAHEQAAALDPDYRPEDSESVWIRQTEDFREHHVCKPAPEGREESI
jgi:hypothetical protein